MKYVVLCGFLSALAGCASETAFRGEPPAGYTHQEYACKLKGDCFSSRMRASWNVSGPPSSTNQP